MPWVVKYDREADWLYVWQDGPQPAVSVDVDGVWVRRAGDRVVGYEIEAFSRTVEETLPVLLRLLGAAGR